MVHVVRATDNFLCGLKARPDQLGEEWGMEVTNNGLRKRSMVDLHGAADRFKNRQRWGSDDEIGTLNHTTGEGIVAAALKESYIGDLQQGS